MVWGWAVASVFLATIALALSSEKYRCFLSWIVGYANTISNIANMTSIEWGGVTVL
ncbi:hypothetical protein MPER_02921 [Moniliophthora perniciosa FA553]|nr:hypothetical protein MPER_02921 [Moniliophthora perniciosa FA553]